MTGQKTKERTERAVVGVDLHPDSFAAAVTSGESASEMKVERRFTKMDCASWDAWLERGIPKGSTVVVEASGNSFEFAKAVQRHGHKAVVLDSVSVGRIAKAYCKNDPKDAVRIAKIYLCGLAESVWIPDEATRTARELSAAYERAVKDQTRSNNRLKMFLNGRRIRLKKGQELSQEATRRWLRSSFKWTAEHEGILDGMFSDYDHAAEQKMKMHRLMAKAVLGNQAIAQLMRLCGIRIVNAYTLLSAIGDIERFASPKKLIAYLGLAPTIIQSGEKSYSGGLQEGGRRVVKSKLIQAAQSILRSKSASGRKLKEWGIKLMMRKSKNLAAAAIARKLAVAVWYALKGFLPDILDTEKDLRTKMLGIARTLRLDFVKKLGYSTARQFADEYTQVILMASGGGGG
jgi:transposase